jgi:hemerythrin-like domain-containing protein
MAVVHNMIIRSLNSIYLQAPHIKPEDALAFANYSLQWWRFLVAHHDGEEKLFFPGVEATTGTKGLMDRNIAQHKAFHDGLDEFGEYVREVIAGGRTYDGKKMVTILDSFSEALVTHLNDEIPTLLALSRFPEENVLGLEKIAQNEAAEVMVSLPEVLFDFSIGGAAG